LDMAVHLVENALELVTYHLGEIALVGMSLISDSAALVKTPELKVTQENGEAGVYWNLSRYKH